MESNSYEYKYYQLKRKVITDEAKHRQERSAVNKRNNKLERQVEIMRGTIARLNHDLEVAQTSDDKKEINRLRTHNKQLQRKIDELKHALDAVKGVNPQDVWMIEDYPLLRQRFREYVKNQEKGAHYWHNERNQRTT